MGWQLWSTKQSQSVKILGNVLGYKITGLWIWLNWWHCTIVDPSIASPSFIFCSLSAMELHIVLTAALVDLLLSFLASMACCFKINSLVKSICVTSLWCDENYFFILPLLLFLVSLFISLVSAVLLLTDLLSLNLFWVWLHILLVSDFTACEPPYIPWSSSKLT